MVRGTIKFERLLSCGLVPPELPPCFNSRALGDNSEFVRELLVDDEIVRSAEEVSRATTFSGYKTDISRREFAVPNPYHFAKASDLISKRSDELFKHFEDNEISLTKPVDAECEVGSFARRSMSVADTKKELKSLYEDNLFEVRLDIQSFFSSIYTHTVAWALHSKEIAKANRSDMELLGNQLDAHMRSMNDGQTNGILIGNDISRLFAEVILCDVDAKIGKRIASSQFRRFVDDYFFFARSRKDVDVVLVAVQQELAAYGLELNASKIRISRSPLLFDNAFVDEIKGYYSLSPAGFLEHIIHLYTRDRDLRVLRYGLSALIDVELSDKEWDNVFPYLVNVWVSSPVLSNVLLPILFANRDRLDLSKIEKAISSIIDDNFLIGNDQEVIWALWAAFRLGAKVEDDVICGIIESENYLASTIALGMVHGRGLKNTGPIKAARSRLREKLMEEHFGGGSLGGMYSEIWLLAYETTRNKWLNIDGARQFDRAKKDPFFKGLLDKGVRFFDESCGMKAQRVKNAQQDRPRGFIESLNNGELDDNGRSTAPSVGQRVPKTMNDIMALAMGY